MSKEPILYKIDDETIDVFCVIVSFRGNPIDRTVENIKPTRKYFSLFNQNDDSIC